MPAGLKPRERCWVWFRNNPLQTGDACWKSGWYGCKSPLGGIYVEHPDYVSARLPDWRVTFVEPDDMKKSPAVEDGPWKLFPTQ